jgi:hypothetical protein
VAEKMENPTGLLNSDQFQIHPWHHIPDNLTNFLPLKEAAQKLHYSQRTLIRKVYQGKIEGFKCYRRWLIEVPSSLVEH